MGNVRLKLSLLASHMQSALFSCGAFFRQQSPILVHMNGMNMTINPLTATAAEVQGALAAGSVTSESLVQLYLDQIAKHNEYLKAIIATAPDDVLYGRAKELDSERAKGIVRGPLHGIPIIVKDNIDTVPGLGLPTTCGSLALVGAKPRKNAAIIDRLLAAGAIILAKANLSEWAWYRSYLADSGWSAVGGQTQPAYVQGGFRKDDSTGGHSNPGGSSSGSAVGVAAGFSPIAVGTETMGSLMMPSDRSALFSLKPTIKLIPQDGIIPVSYEADSTGPMTKSTQDLADLLDVLVDSGKPGVPKEGYRSAVTGAWGDIRVGFVEPEKWLHSTTIVKYEKEATDQMLSEFKSAYEELKRKVKIVKRVSLLSVSEATQDGAKDIWTAFDSTFRKDIEEYFASVDHTKVRTLEDLIEFNKQHAEQELTRGANYNQDGLIRALKSNMTDTKYHELVDHARNVCGPQGIERALKDNGIDVIIGPGDGPLFMISGTAGYPGASLPLGYLKFNGRAFGMQAIARAYDEALLITVQSAWEATFPNRQPPSL